MVTVSSGQTRKPITSKCISSERCMQITVYYIVHKDTGRRLKWYRTLAGARIACRSRNSRLGFTTRVTRCTEADIEYELCTTQEHASILATYCIVEDYIDHDASGLEEMTNG
jgi:hypothetical protein